MRILAGLTDHQVLQRNAENVCETVIECAGELAGDLMVHVSQDGETLDGWEWRTVGEVSAGECECLVSGIPVGGPYNISLRIGDTEGVSFRDVLVGDVWILGGQSNMQGIGLIEDAAKPHPQVRAFYMNDQWATAEDPIHNLWDAVDPVHTHLNGGTPCKRNPAVGVGPGVAFGQAMYELSGVPQGLIPCAHGGTSMSQWSPESKDKNGDSLYGAMLRRFWKNGQRVAGVVWYQGCNDTVDGEFDFYTERMVQFVSEIRRDIDKPRLPFAMVQLATWFWPTGFTGTNISGWNSIREQQRLLAEKVEDLVVVPAIDLELDDPIHISGREQQRLGHRLAEAMWTLSGEDNASEPPITVGAVNFLKADYPVIEISMNHVMGRLKSTGKPTGFTVTDTQGNPLPAIFRTELQGSRILLHTSIRQEIEISEFDLYYGFGPAAYCNIVDEGNRSLPAFGPIRVCVHGEESCWYVKTVRRSECLPMTKGLHDVSCPGTDDLSLGWKEQTFETSFLDLHDEIQAYVDDRMVFYHLSFECKVAGKLVIGLGYDGPIKVWFDGKEIFFDPEGGNPMLFDQHKAGVKADAGKHDLVIGLSTNHGQAWGVGLRVYHVDDLAGTLECANGQ